MRYRQGWKALNRLLHEDRSFSGHEHNCAFLNTGEGRFAKVASVSGLDYADDGRAVAVCDWDFDGRLDLWITNRTAPRLRFLRNQYSTKRHFVGFKLQGNGRTTNRDAIGARVELYVDDASNPTCIKTLHAGDGFLSQSSNWMHFGLGSSESVSRLVIQWPGGERETIRSLAADRFYMIQQGSGAARAWNPRAGRRTIESTVVAIPAETEQARIVLPARLPLPGLAVFKPGESEEVADLDIDGPALVNVWSRSCAPCLKELTQWTQHAGELRDHGINVVALNTDRLEPDGNSSTADEFLSRIGFPFPGHYAAPKTVNNLDLFQRAVLDRWRPLPLPCTFLIDRNGQVAVIYKGAAPFEQITADFALIDAGPVELRMAAVPFPGRWIQDVPVPDPLRVVVQFVDHDQVRPGIDYLHRFVRLTEHPSMSDSDNARIGDIYYVMGVLLEDQDNKQESVAMYQLAKQFNPRDFRVRNDLGRLLGHLGRFDEACEELAAAVEINPDQLDVRRRLGMALLQQNRMDEAIVQFKRILEARPDDAVIHFHLANAMRRAGNWQPAVQQYREAIRYRPGMLLAANNLAWILATHPDDTIRNGREAVELAERICQATDFRQPSLLDTLAVAYAEVGDYDKAIATSNRAIDLLQQSGRSEDQIEPIRERLRYFQQGQPYRLVE